MSDKKDNNLSKRIAIIVELKKREMAYLSILKRLLEDRGHIVKFVSFKNHCTWSLISFRPDVILINGLRTTCPSFVSQIYIPKKLFGSRVICYYVEQVGYFDETVAAGYNNPLILRNVECHVAWGGRFAKDLIGLGAKADNTWYIGSMQYDLDYYLRENTASLRKKFGNHYNLDISKKWLIYCDNIMQRYTAADKYAIRREESFRIIEKIAQNNPESRIIFRPHPETSTEEKTVMKKRFAKYGNVVFNDEGHLFYWIMACDAMLIWQSTSALSAIFLDKPVFGFKTSDGQDECLYWYKKMVPTYTDHNRLVEDVTTYLQNGNYVISEETRKARDKYISDFFYRKDGRSFNRLIALIEMFADAPKCKYADEEFRFWGIRLLLAELKQFIVDAVHGSVKDLRVNRDEELSELAKYDTARFDGSVRYVSIKTDCGNEIVEEMLK